MFSKSNKKQNHSETKSKITNLIKEQPQNDTTVWVAIVALHHLWIAPHNRSSKSTMGTQLTIVTHDRTT